jgi:hypothetical protein
MPEPVAEAASSLKSNRPASAPALATKASYTVLPPASFWTSESSRGLRLICARCAVVSRPQTGLKPYCNLTQGDSLLF